MPSEREMEQRLREKVAEVEAKPLMNLNTQAGACCGSAVYAPDPRQLIADRMQYHRQQLSELDALFNALPLSLPLPAANALAKVLLEARPRY